MSTLRLNLGSGFRPLKGYVNVDYRKECRPDLLCDVSEGLPYKDETVSEVVAVDFLEHIPIGKTVGVIEEIYRVLIPNGRFQSLTPSTDGRGAFQDPTHVSFWNINSWLYYTDQKHRELYGVTADFKIEKLEDVTLGPDKSIVHTFAILRKR